MQTSKYGWLETLRVCSFVQKHNLPQKDLVMFFKKPSLNPSVSSITNSEKRQTEKSYRGMAFMLV